MEIDFCILEMRKGEPQMWITDLFRVQDKIREEKKGMDNVIGSLTASITKLCSWFGGGARETSWAQNVTNVKENNRAPTAAVPCKQSSAFWRAMWDFAGALKELRSAQRKQQGLEKWGTWNNKMRILLSLNKRYSDYKIYIWKYSYKKIKWTFKK